MVELSATKPATPPGITWVRRAGGNPAGQKQDLPKAVYAEAIHTWRGNKRDHVICLLRHSLCTGSNGLRIIGCAYSLMGKVIEEDITLTSIQLNLRWVLLIKSLVIS